MLLWLLRCSFLAIIIGTATSFALHYIQDKKDTVTGLVVFGVTLVAGLATVTGDLAVKHKQITTVSAVYSGLLMGLLLGTLFWMALEPFLNDYQEIKPRLRLMLTVILCYVSTSFLL